jgi:2-dehydropantoate 2-reductase
MRRLGRLLDTLGEPQETTGQAGRYVTFLVRPHRAETIRAGGLQVVSPHGDFTFYPKVITTTEIAFTYDVILLSVKSYALLSRMRY